MPRKPFSPLAKATIMTLSLGVFTILWPIGTGALISAIGGRPTHVIDMNFAIMMAIVDLPIGIHVGMLITRRTIWLAEPGTRAPFLWLSAFFAALITLFDGICSVVGSGPIYRDHDANLCWYVFLASAQGLPILWFVYNLHGGMWLRMFALRRNRPARNGYRL